MIAPPIRAAPAATSSATVTASTTWSSLSRSIGRAGARNDRSGRALRRRLDRRQVAVRHPDRVRRLALIAASGLFVRRADRRRVPACAARRGVELTTLRQLLFADASTPVGLRLFPTDAATSTRRCAAIRCCGSAPSWASSRPTSTTAPRRPTAPPCRQQWCGRARSHGPALPWRGLCGRIAGRGRVDAGRRSGPFGGARSSPTLRRKPSSIFYAPQTTKSPGWKPSAFQQCTQSMPIRRYHSVPPCSRGNCARIFGSGSGADVHTAW